MTQHDPGGRPTGDPHRFSRWLREILHWRRMTQTALAKATGVNQGMVSRWVNGSSVPSPQSIQAIAKALDVPVAEALLQAGHIDHHQDTEGAPEREQLHRLVDRLPMQLLGPYVAVFEALTSMEESDER